MVLSCWINYDSPIFWLLCANSALVIFKEYVVVRKSFREKDERNQRKGNGFYMRLAEQFGTLQIWDKITFTFGIYTRGYKVVNNIKGWLGSICHWFGSLNEDWYKPHKEPSLNAVSNKPMDFSKWHCVN